MILFFTNDYEMWIRSTKKKYFFVVGLCYSVCIYDRQGNTKNNRYIKKNNFFLLLTSIKIKGLSNLTYVIVFSFTVACKKP